MWDKQGYLQDLAHSITQACDSSGRGTESFGPAWKCSTMLFACQFCFSDLTVDLHHSLDYRKNARVKGQACLGLPKATQIKDSMQGQGCHVNYAIPTHKQNSNKLVKLYQAACHEQVHACTSLKSDCITRAVHQKAVVQ